MITVKDGIAFFSKHIVKYLLLINNNLNNFLKLSPFKTDRIGSSMGSHGGFRHSCVNLCLL